MTLPVETVPPGGAFTARRGPVRVRCGCCGTGGRLEKGETFNACPSLGRNA